MNKGFFMSYGNYYTSGLYSERYKDSIPIRSFYAVKNMILKCVLKKNDELFLSHSSCKTNLLRVLDYGCGDGRYFDVFRAVAIELESYNILLEITGVDPIKEGLSLYKRKLIEKNFLVIEDKAFMSEDDLRSIQVCIFENLEMKMRIRLVQNHPDNDLSQESAVIGKHDCGLCMFGVLSHISSDSRRINTMQVLSFLIRDTVLFTVPNAKRCFLDEQKKFGSRDIFYSRNSQVRNFYHLYTREEIEASVKNIKTKVIRGVFSANILDETTLVRYKFIDIIDSFISENMPSEFVEYFCKYFLFELQATDNTLSDENAILAKTDSLHERSY